MLFHIFRIQIFGESLFKPANSRKEIFHQVMRASVHRKTSKGWRLSAPIKLGQTDAILAQFGRSKVLNVPSFDDEQYIYKPINTAPFTYVIFDYECELCAIGHNRDLATSTTQVAKELTKLFTKTCAYLTPESHIEFDIQAVLNPELISDAIRKSYQVTSLIAEFRRANAFDINKEIIRPAQAIMDEAQAERGSFTLKGKNLEKSTVEDVVRSLAATGDNAIVKLKENKSGRTIRKSLRGESQVSIEIEEIKKLRPLGEDESLTQELADCGFVYRIRAFVANLRKGALGPGASGRMAPALEEKT